MKTERPRLNALDFAELKIKVDHVLSGNVKKRCGWKVALCRHYSISYFTLAKIIDGKQLIPPFTDNYTANDPTYVRKVIKQKLPVCGFCGGYIRRGQEHEANGTLYCCANHLRISVEFRKHESKEPHPITGFSRSGRMAAKPRYTTGGK